ncbi:MAG TPA: DegV family protein [Aggregatilineales bacterium]|nr:DegV family protein [Aggregatilineales bacterium]
MRIVTDSAAEITPEEIQRWGIQVVPLLIEFPGEEIPASALAPDEFYDRLRAMEPLIPTTAQPSVGMLVDVYRRLAAEGEEILSIHISSGLSGTANAARTASRQVPDAVITVVDTLTLSAAQRIPVLAAAMAVKKGWTVDKIVERLSAIHAASEIAFTLETLDYLARGGRIGRVQALAGSLLKVKPIITVEKSDGKYSTLGKRRTLQQTMTAIVDFFAAKFGTSTPLWITLMHGQISEKAELLATMLKSKLNVARLDIRRVSPALGVHTGPAVVGAGVVPIELVADLLDADRDNRSESVLAAPL